ncbi:putative protein OS=Streptomyces aurantiogriseus OX=66870 GN=GCM10010251_62360 PE=4 SV=1 [Streptomyces aurantiogriseus]|uniref:Uncharacterized protein n=1 Tax=Streptomyces aurantiogriseus TaxID=66870 RepID=A0A918KWE4_9ACTN|nr:hypothetical protein GCM10010251_62360 [Streptomyces aurantiogriseus]
MDAWHRIFAHHHAGHSSIDGTGGVGAGHVVIGNRQGVKCDHDSACGRLGNND